MYMPSLTTLLWAIGAVVLLPVILSAVLPFSIKRVGWFKVRGLSWYIPFGASPASPRSNKLLLTIDKIGLTAVGSPTCSRGWFVLQLTGLRLKVPKSWILDFAPKPASTKPPKMAVQAAADKAHPAKLADRPADVRLVSARRKRHRSRLPPLASHLLAHLADLVRVRVLAPLWRRLGLLAHLSAACVAMCAVEVEFVVEVEGVAEVRGRISAGGSLVLPSSKEQRASDVSDEDGARLPLPSKVGFWLAVGELEVLRAPCPETGAATATPSASASALQPAARLPALAMPAKLLISVALPVQFTTTTSKSAGSRVPLGSVEVDIRFGSEDADGPDEGGVTDGVHVRAPELTQIMCAAEEMAEQAKERKAAAKAEGRAHPEPSPTFVGEPGTSTKPSPARFLRSISASLPLLVLSAYYHTPPGLHDLPSLTPLPKSVAFALTVKAVKGRIVMGETTEAEGVNPCHRAWLGRERRLGVGGRFEWDAVEGRIRANGSAEDILPNSSQAFSVARSSVGLTSTWLPASLSEPTPYPADPNEPTVIVEAHLGAIRGHATFETLDSALRIFKARPKAPRRAPTPRAACPAAPQVKGLPRIIGVGHSDGIEIQIQAPIAPVEEGLHPDDSFWRPWSSPELFCISLPEGQLSFGGRYAERSLRRSQTERLAAKRAGKRQVELQANKEHASNRPQWTPSAEQEKELGLPPPPPLHHAAYQRVPSAPKTWELQQLGEYPLEYRTRWHLSAGSLAVFILATNHGHPHERGEEGELPSLPSDPARLNILSIGPVEVTSQQVILGTEVHGARGVEPNLDLSTRKGFVNLLVENITVDCWRPLVLGAIKDFLISFASATASATSRARKPSVVDSPPVLAPKPLVFFLPAEMRLYGAVGTLDVRIAGSDPKNDWQACRGVAIHCGSLVVEALRAAEIKHDVSPSRRLALELREDIRVEANAAVAVDNERPSLLIKCGMNDFRVLPVVDARSSRGHSRKFGSLVDEHEAEQADWELKNRAHIADLDKRRKSVAPTSRDTPPRSPSVDGEDDEDKRPAKAIFSIPHLAVRLKVREYLADAEEKEALDDAAETPLDDVTVTLQSEAPTVRIDLFSIYLCLVAISALRSLKPEIVPHSAEPSPEPSSSNQFSKSHRPKPLVQVRADFDELHLFPTLPHMVHLYFNLRRPQFEFSQKLGLRAQWDALLLAGDSPTMAGKWEDIFRLKMTKLGVRPQAGSANQGSQAFVVDVRSDSARLRIPFRFIFSRIVDNTANLLKATKQLVHQHLKGGMDSILEPEEEAAKRLPQISIQIPVLAVELQDDPFETRLNIIWRAGYEEQAARIEREAAFDAKVDAIERAVRGEVDETDGDEHVEGQHHSSTHSTPRKARKVTGAHTVGIEEARANMQVYNSTHWAKRMRNAVAEQARREELVVRKLYGPKVTDTKRPDAKLPIELVPSTRSAPLARATFQDLHLAITKPSFPLDQLPEYLHKVGKGLPKDTRFTLLIPLHISWQMEEFRVQLRDYPLPLLHIPPVDRGRPGHELSPPAWSFETDLVIGEELASADSTRRVPTEIVPAHAAHGKGPLYSIVVPRSAMPVKTYAEPVIKVRTPYATRIGWGNSIQPAIQDVAKVIDTLSKPSPDPSDRIGFWDKLRLQFHWRVQFLFEGDGPVHFHLKGGRDPYALTGFGAGFAKAWKGNIKFLIGLDNPDKEFFQIISDDYILGIPNLRGYVDEAASGMTSHDSSDSGYETARDSGSSTDGRFGVEADFIKICAKFKNGVRWGMGAVLERTCERDCANPACANQSTFHRKCRFFDDFTPHWQVYTVTPETAARHADGTVVDSFKGFRSDFIHFSLSLTSPLTLSLPSNADSPVSGRNSSPRSHSTADQAGGSVGEGDGEGEGEGETPPQHGYNSLHFSPQGSTHFWRWWNLFDGTMSLPIRQGKLFPSAQAPSKKFGKHCATIKYRFSLAPLFIAHTYKQESAEEWQDGVTTVLGLKGKIGRFNVDLHQREQEEIIHKPDSAEMKKVIHKAFYMCEVDLDGVDLRAITATFDEPEKQAVVHNLPELDHDHQDEGARGRARATPLTAEEEMEQQEWRDLDDFSDLTYAVWDRQPELRVMPFVVCPRFTYFRNADASNKPASDKDDDPHSVVDDNGDEPEMTVLDPPKTKFGKEPSHTCLMGCATDSLLIQIDLAEARLAQLHDEAENPAANVHEGTAAELQLRIAATQRIVDRLVHLRDCNKTKPDEGAFPQPDTLDKEPSAGQKADINVPKQGWTDQRTAQAFAVPVKAKPEESHEDSSDDIHLPHLTNSLYQEWGGWENRYMVHNPTIQVSNLTREVLLQYYYSHRERRGLVYHLSASAIKFIRDLATEHERKHRRHWSRRKSTRTGSTARKPEADSADPDGNQLLEDLLNRAPAGIWAADDASQRGGTSFGDKLNVDPNCAADDLPDAYDLQSSHLCMFIKPQIALKSDVDAKSSVILTAFRATVKVFAILDAQLPDDAVNTMVKHQTYANLDGLQAFYPREQSRGQKGAAFVPLETLVDLKIDPWGFDRVVPRTSAAMRYDKYNNLRMTSQSSRHSHEGGRKPTGQTDRISVHCEKFSVSAEPDHFAAIYNVVTDLLLYSDPVQAQRNKELQEMVFTNDFSNLAGSAERVMDLQHKIRSLVELAQQYQIHLDELDEWGRQELLVHRAELNLLSNQLSVLVSAITLAQDLNGAVDKRDKTKTGAGVQLEAIAEELVWHMLDKTGMSFAKFSITGVEFSWATKTDSSVQNRLLIKDLKALNSSPDSVFPEIISKHDRVENHQLCKADMFAAALWNGLPAVGGIAIVERLELHLHPIKLNLEHAVGKMIMDYVFQQDKDKRADGRSTKGDSDDDESDDDDDDASVRSPKGGKRSNSSGNRSGSLLLPYNRSAESVNSTARSSRSLLGPDDSSPRLPLNSSSASIASSFEHRLRHTASAEMLAVQANEEEAGLDAVEMRRRAAKNRAFVLVECSSTVLCLSYRSPKGGTGSFKHLPDLRDITYSTPPIQYRGKTWSWEDLLQAIKRDMIKSVWGQKGALVGQLLNKAHRTLPLQDARSQVKKSVAKGFRARMKALGSGHSSGVSTPRSGSPLVQMAVQRSQSSDRTGSAPARKREDTGATVRPQGTLVPPRVVVQASTPSELVEHALQSDDHEQQGAVDSVELRHRIEELESDSSLGAEPFDPDRVLGASGSPIVNEPEEMDDEEQERSSTFARGRRADDVTEVSGTG